MRENWLRMHVREREEEGGREKGQRVDGIMVYRNIFFIMFFFLYLIKKS